MTNEVGGCYLSGYGNCCGAIQQHHWMSKAPYRKSKPVRAYVKKHEKFFTVDMCMAHNVGRIADTKWARKVILEKLEVEHGEAKCRAMPEDE